MKGNEMSKDILELEQKFGAEMGEQNSKRLIVTAFVGGEHGACIQLTLITTISRLQKNR